MDRVIVTGNAGRRGEARRGRGPGGQSLEFEVELHSRRHLAPGAGDVARFEL